MLFESVECWFSIYRLVFGLKLKLKHAKVTFPLDFLIALSFSLVSKFHSFGNVKYEITSKLVYSCIFKDPGIVNEHKEHS